ncbi:MAG: DNA-processing protein DprA [Rikenellaceae bacterium]
MLLDDIALTLESKVNLKTLAHLMSHFSSAEAIYAAGADELVARCELKRELAESISKKSAHTKALEQLRHINRHKITALRPEDENYPRLLGEIPDPAHVLYLMGDSSILNSRMVTMVGTRDITSYGHRMCDRLVKELSEIDSNIVIVSGLAYGIDAECHRAALRYGLRTVAVVKDILPEVSPKGNELLASEILSSGGCILSESNIFTHFYKSEYKRRNRIMAAMSMATVVVESKDKSGANSTAFLARDYNREVFAVPGRIDEKSSEGTNNLIKSSHAQILTSAMDLALELGWDCESTTLKNAEVQEVELSEVQAKIMELIPAGAVVYSDFISQNSGINQGDLMAEMFELELSGLVRTLPGGRYERV